MRIRHKIKPEISREQYGLAEEKGSENAAAHRSAYFKLYWKRLSKDNRCLHRTILEEVVEVQQMFTSNYT